MPGWIEILLLLILVVLVTKPLGTYLHYVICGDLCTKYRVFRKIENTIIDICCIDSEQQNWKEYFFSFMFLSLFGGMSVFLVLLIQGNLAFNPQKLPGLSWDLAFNTAVSFMTTTNWQSYAGESTLSYFSQASLSFVSFIGAASGISVAIAVARGIANEDSNIDGKLLGNFWVDFIRCSVFVLFPICLVISLVFMSQGTIQNFSDYINFKTLEGAEQILPMGPVASQEAIKIFGVNGGGFFGVNSSHPFENPTPLTNFLQILLMISIPASLTYVYGKITGKQNHGWVLFGVMMVMLIAGLVAVVSFESSSETLQEFAFVNQSEGILEGKEQRFGTLSSALYGVVSSAVSGSVNSMHDSYSPLGGMVLMLNILIGGVIFGGAGTGLLGMLIFVFIAVFIAGLMSGRTPQYLGKKITAHDIKLLVTYGVIYQITILIGTSLSLHVPGGIEGIQDQGIHGISEVLYAFASATINNGSGFAGIESDNTWYNSALAVAMLIGRFLLVGVMLAIAGSFAERRNTSNRLHDVPVDTTLFAFLLLFAIINVVLVFIPILILGPVAEYLITVS